MKNDPDHRALLENWLRSYRPEELFDADGSPNELVRSASVSGELRMSATPYANGGLLARDLDLPDFPQLRGHTGVARHARRIDPPFDMTVKNKASRYYLVMDAINNAKRTPAGATDLMAWCRAQLLAHDAYVVEHLEDLPQIRDWRWQRPNG